MSWNSASVFFFFVRSLPPLSRFSHVFSLSFRFDLSDVETLNNIADWVAQIARYANEDHQKVLVGIKNAHTQ